MIAKGKKIAKNEKVQEYAAVSLLIAVIAGGAYFVGRHGICTKKKRVALFQSDNIEIVQVEQQPRASCGACAIINGNRMVQAITAGRDFQAQPYGDEIQKLYNLCGVEKGVLLENSDITRIVRNLAEDNGENNFCIFAGINREEYMSSVTMKARIEEFYISEKVTLPVIVNLNNGHWIVDVLYKGSDGTVYHKIADSVNNIKSMSNVPEDLADLIAMEQSIAKEVRK